MIDAPTNSALSNNLLDTKRLILKERSERGETFIPIGTRMAFNKQFSDDVNDLKFWEKINREDYFNEIERVYNLFISKINIDNEQ